MWKILEEKMKSLKRKLIQVLVPLFAVCICSCGNTTSRTINEKITIPENGIIEEEIFRQIKNDNLISRFTGESNGIKYEWTIFGSEISEPHQLNMAVDIYKKDNAIEVEFMSEESFGFNSLLSIYLDERWEVQNVSAFNDELISVGNVSVTGTDSSILNFSVSETYGKYIIKPDSEKTETTSTTITSTVITKNKSTTTISSLESTTVPENTTVIPTETVSFVEETDYVEIPEDILYYDEYEEIEQETEPEDSRIYSDGNQTEQDKYLTDPIPEGEPLPVEPDDVEINDSNVMTCTFSIECTTILNNISDLDPEKLDVLPVDGIIFEQQTVEFSEGESVFDVLKRVCQENKIHMEYTETPVYNSVYIEGINNIYEFDCGSLSGWKYCVNGWYPNYGCSRYQLAEGDVIEWRFTCNLGKDIGCDWLS